MNHLRSRPSGSSSGAVVTAPDVASALNLAIGDPRAMVEVFLADWVEVDLARAHVASLGLSGRIVVHHLAALVTLRRLCILPAVSAASALDADRCAPRSLRRFLHSVSAACAARNPSSPLQHGALS
jgi:hypothetical protein